MKRPLRKLPPREIASKPPSEWPKHLRPVAGAAKANGRAERMNRYLRCPPGGPLLARQIDAAVALLLATDLTVAQLLALEVRDLVLWPRESAHVIVRPASWRYQACTVPIPAPVARAIALGITMPRRKRGRFFPPFDQLDDERRKRFRRWLAAAESARDGELYGVPEAEERPA